MAKTIMGHPQPLNVADPVDGIRESTPPEKSAVEGYKLVQTETGLQMHLEVDGFSVVISENHDPEQKVEAFSPDSPQFVSDAERVMRRAHTELQAAIESLGDQDELWGPQSLSNINVESLPPGSLRLSSRPKSYEEIVIEETLKGTVKTLNAALSLANLEGFGRSRRVQKIVRQIMLAMGTQGRWRIEMAAMLYHLGALALPQDLVQKVNMGLDLTRTEKTLLAKVPDVSVKLIKAIPRLDTVRELISELGILAVSKRQGRAPEDQGAGILLVAVDYDALRSAAYSKQRALEIMRKERGKYGPEILDALEGTLEEEEDESKEKEIPIRLVREGMIFAADVRKQNGVLFVSKGFKVNRSFLQRVKQFPPGAVREPVKVIVPPEV